MTVGSINCGAPIEKGTHHINRIIADCGRKGMSMIEIGISTGLDQRLCHFVFVGVTRDRTGEDVL